MFAPVGGCFVDGNEAHLVPDPMVAVNLGDRNVAVRAQALGHVGHRRGYIKMKRRAQAAERHPFGQRFEVIHRFNGLDLDNLFDLPAPILRCQHDIRINSRRPSSDGGVLLHAWVDTDVEATAKLGLENTDDPVVLELLSDRPDEDGAHENGTITWITPV